MNMQNLEPSPLAEEGRVRGWMFARQLRRNQTDAEKALWMALRNRQINQLKFRRQVPIGRYIVDFICFENRLIIELDGGQHADAKEYDEERTRWLESQGFIVTRFWNNDVMSNLEGVLMRVMEWTASPLTQPSPARGEGFNTEQ